MSTFCNLKLEASGESREQAIKHVERLLDFMREENGFSVSTVRGSAVATWHEQQGDDDNEPEPVKTL